MKTYGDIINRIIEIIKYSEDRKRELQKGEIGKNFSKILFQDIANEYAEEFRDLLVTEMVFYKIYNTPNASKKNDALLLECEQKGSTSDDNTDDYLELMTILRNAQNQLPLSLTEYKGYFVLKDEISEFIRLCRKLNVGHYKKIIDNPSAQIKKEIMDNLNETQIQFKRISFSIEQLQNTTIGNSKIEDSQDVYKNENPTYLSGKYKTMVYLGMSSKLTMDMVVQVKNVLSQTEFDELLAELKKYGVYRQEEINKIIELSNSKTHSIHDIDEFIAYIILQEHLNIKSLKEEVIQLYGYGNYHYFMEKLYQYGKIDFYDYLDSLNELFPSHSRK